jgi:murein L,D-transpeptidase YcbB/YkuD
MFQLRQIIPYHKPVLPKIIITLLGSAALLCSCGNKKDSGGGFSLFKSDFVDESAFAQMITSQINTLDTADSTYRKRLLTDAEVFTNHTYFLADKKPIWYNSDGLKKAAYNLVPHIKDLAAEGIALDLDLKRAEYILSQSNEKAPVTDSVVLWDKTLTKLYLSAAQQLLLGKTEKNKEEQWFASNDTAFLGPALLAKQMGVESVFPIFDSFRPQHRYYRQMLTEANEWRSLLKDSTYLALRADWDHSKDKNTAAALIKKELPGVEIVPNDTTDWQTAALRTYQYYRHIRPTGKLDSTTVAYLNKHPDAYINKLMLNMNRMRQLPRQVGNEYVWVNIPLMELDYLRDEQQKFHAKVVVGKTARQTPTILARMTNIVFNPPWGVPPTILKNDVGPGVARSGTGYLARKGLRAYDSKGNDVTASVNASNYKKFSYRQPPGAHNSLGEIKFNMPNKWDIYIHDTPHRENFGARMRALSSGCVRVQNPKEFAEIILEDKQFNRSKIDSIIDTRKTKHEKLERNIDVYIVYMTVAPDSSGTRMRYLYDIYNRDLQTVTKNTLAAK